jgi:hypothetical protein
MIDEEATFKKFKYYSSDLKRKSGKRILAACGDCGKVRETSKHLYRPLCMSCVRKGEKNHFFGRHHTEETKTLLSATSKGNTNCLERVCTEGTKALLSAALKGKHPSDKTRALMSVANKGEKNCNWKGGISFEPYCVKFNNAFKEYIRAKFGYTCFLCPTTQAENGRKLSVHHVNYNKNCACDGDKTCQFVPLCVRCHSKTNGNRAYWQKLITDKLHCLIIGWNV